MSTPLTPRQRVYVALRHEVPDRVPTALGGGPYGIVDDLYFRLLDFFRLGEAVPPFRKGHNISYMDDRLLSCLGTDFRYCWPARLPNSPVIPGPDENTFYDSFGQIWKRALPYYYAGSGLLQDTTDIGDIERLVHWPDPHDPSWMEGVEQRAKELQTQTPYFVAMRMVASHGPFQTACDLRGTENFLTDLIEHPDFALALLDRITALLEGLLDAAMQAGGRWFDMIELPGDDYAGNTGLILSPVMFRRFIKPCLARMIHTIRRHKPEIKIQLHSDGAIARLIPDFIELGVDVLHPLEPLPATNIPEIKQMYGHQISFLGGIDISRAMLGNREEVVQEVKTRLAQLAEGGGYILAPANHLQADVPAENVAALFEAAREWGKYPLAFSSSP